MQYEHPQLVPLGSGLQLILAPYSQKTLVLNDGTLPVACFHEEAED